jgi:hypothetical protein
MSTHTAMLDCDNIPEQARHAHIVPGLHHTSLISIKALCDAGCSVVYNSDECRVYLKGKLVWTGIREPSTGLWILPLTPRKENLHALDLHQPHRPAETANSAYSMSSKESHIKFLHRCLLSPPKKTLLKALENNQFTSWPGFTLTAVKKYLPESSPATDKGHMKRHKQGLWSTKLKGVQHELDMIEYNRDMNPPVEHEKFNQLFCSPILLDNKNGTVYTDFTGKFPLRSIDGMTSIFILYDWSSNSILATPVTDFKESTIVDTFKDNLRYLTE